MLDLQMIIGLAFLAVLLMIITVFYAGKIFEEEPYFQAGLIVGEISFIILVIVNPEWLRHISFLFALLIVVLTFISSVILSWQTIILGIPSMIFFLYSFLVGKGTLWVMVGTALIFTVGLVLNLREIEQSIEMIGGLFPVFAFSLAIVGVFLIPNVFPQFDLLIGIAEITGTALGLIIFLGLIAYAWLTSHHAS